MTTRGAARSWVAPCYIGLKGRNNMSIQEIGKVLGGGGVLVVVMTLVQIAPVKLNPWSAVGRLLKKLWGACGKAFSADVLHELSQVRLENAQLKQSIEQVEGKLDKHILTDDCRTADGYRAQILHFNNELLRPIRHTKEEFIEVLAKIDAYEKYCGAHPEYPNSRAILAVENIRETYMERLKKRDFLQDSGSEEA